MTVPYTVTVDEDEEGTDAQVILTVLASDHFFEWEWGSMPAFIPFADHDTHIHPMGAFAFPKEVPTTQALEVFAQENSPMDRVPPPPDRVFGVALVWEAFIAPRKQDDTPPGDHPDDREARLCAVVRIESGEGSDVYITSEAVHVRQEDLIGRPKWQDGSNTLPDEAWDQLRTITKRLSLLEPERRKDE